MYVPFSAEKIKSNYDLFEALCTKKLREEHTGPISTLFERFGERIMLAPASSHRKYHNAFPGGLVDHSLRVMKNALTIKKQFFDSMVDTTSIILVSLFHDLGKIGDENASYYLDQTSDWHAERGEVYKRNDALQYMTIPHRSIFLLQRIGVRLLQDEFTAIMIHDGQYADENRLYRMNEPTLAVIVHQADCLATLVEKQLHPFSTMNQ